MPMNKYQYEEALEILLENTTPKDMNPDRLDSLDHAEMVLKELVDKETPVKPKVLSQDILCGKCGSSVGNNNGWTQALVEFCRYCGTRIDWSEND